MRGSFKRSLLVVAKPAGNVPRMLNLADNLLKAGVRVLEVGRHKSGERRIIRLGSRHWVLNIEMASEVIKFPILRKFLIYIEFIARCSVLANRVNADFLFTFYNPAAVVHRFVKTDKTKKIAWLLDFWHPYYLTVQHRLLEKIGESGWRFADAIVVPTRERLALHYSQRPECLNIQSFVVHNSPNSKTVVIREKNNYADRVSKHKNQLDFVYAGTVGEGYGLEAIIEVVGNHDFQVKLTILGKKMFLEEGCDLGIKDFQEKIICLIGNTKHPDRIRWLDSVPYKELADHLENYDIGYVTYALGKNLNDRFSAPGKIYDYISAGVIPMTDTESPIALQLEAANCGFIFSYPPDIQSIGDAVDRAVEGRDGIERMRARLQIVFNESLSQQRQLIPLFRYLGLG